MKRRRATPDVTKGAFDELYADALKKVHSHWSPELQAGLANHNQGWAVGKLDFGDYLRQSSKRYWRAYLAITGFGGVSTVCDVGGFWGLLPLVLKRIGYEVSMTEALEYYGPAFDGLFAFLQGEGIRVIDHDPFGPSPLRESFDFLTIMAVLEHYPHSLREFMSNVRAMLGPGGGAYVEVPNLAYWYKRVALFRDGISPMPPIEDIWASRTPFTGHHHEFTSKELVTLASLAGFTVVDMETFNYSADRQPLRILLRHPLSIGIADLVMRRYPATREVIGATWRVDNAVD